MFRLFTDCIGENVVNMYICMYNKSFLIFSKLFSKIICRPSFKY